MTRLQKYLLNTWKSFHFTNYYLQLYTRSIGYKTLCLRSLSRETKYISVYHGEKKIISINLSKNNDYCYTEHAFEVPGTF